MGSWQTIFRSDISAGEILRVEETDDIEMSDVSNQPSGELKPSGVAEEKSSMETKPFHLMERDSAGSAGRVVNIGWKPSEQSKREEVSALQSLAVAG